MSATGSTHGAPRISVAAFPCLGFLVIFLQPLYISSPRESYDLYSLPVLFPPRKRFPGIFEYGAATFQLAWTNGLRSGLNKEQS